MKFLFFVILVGLLIFFATRRDKFERIFLTTAALYLIGYGVYLFYVI